MLFELKRMIDKDETLAADDVRRAAATVLERQFLFSDKKRDQRSYQQIIDAEDYYSNLFDALNLNLICDRVAGYVGVIPRESSLTVSMDTEHSLFLLVLRVIYERCAQECRMGENSQAFTNSSIVVEAFEAHTGKSRPGLGRLREILKSFSRQGIVEIDEDEDKAIHFRIRPTVRDIVTHGFLQALEEYCTISQGEDSNTEVIGGDDENTF